MHVPLWHHVKRETKGFLTLLLSKRQSQQKKEINRTQISRLFLLSLLKPHISTALSLTVSYQEHQKDATYITVSSRPTPGSEHGTRILKSMSLKAAIAKGQIVRIGETAKAGGAVKPGAFEVNTFFRRLAFTRQVRQSTGKLQ